MIDPAQISYEDGAHVALEARPERGWRFAGWRGAVIGNSPRETIVITANQAITAEFYRVHSLDLFEVGEGQVVITPASGLLRPGTSYH